MSPAEERAIRSRIENAVATEMGKRGYEGDDLFCYAIGQIVIYELRAAASPRAGVDTRAVMTMGDGAVHIWDGRGEPT